MLLIFVAKVPGYSLKNCFHLSITIYRTAPNFDGENIDGFDEFPAVHQYFPIKIFHLVRYLPLMNLWRFGSTQNKITYISEAPPRVSLFTVTAQGSLRIPIIAHKYSRELNPLLNKREN